MFRFDHILIRDAAYGGVAAMVIYSSKDHRTVVVDGSSTAPAAARAETFELAPLNTVGGMYGWRGTVGDAQNTWWCRWSWSVARLRIEQPC